MGAGVGGWASLGTWLGLPRPDRGVGRDPGARGGTVQKAITGRGREGWRGQAEPHRGFPRLAQGHMHMTRT